MPSHGTASKKLGLVLARHRTVTPDRAAWWGYPALSAPSPRQAARKAQREAHTAAMIEAQATVMRVAGRAMARFQIDPEDEITAA
jgi:hypothetical protein